MAIKQITKKQLAKSQSLLEKEIKILKVRSNLRLPCVSHLDPLLLQELTKLKHDNLVALLDCKVNQTTWSNASSLSSLRLGISKQCLPGYGGQFCVLVQRRIERDSFLSAAFSIAMVATWQIIFKLDSR